MRTAKEIINDINFYQPHDGQWFILDSLLNELWATGQQEKFTDDLLKVFERFPEEDGSGVFWSILHGIEGFQSYEQNLVASLYRQPSEMGILMLRRIKNTGITTVDGKGIEIIVKELLLNVKITPFLRRELEGILQ